MKRASQAPGNKGWGGSPPLRDAARERLLDAALRCLDRIELSALGISHVAAEAGVTRPTVYRYFADRDALLAALIARGGLRLATDLRAHIAALSSPEEMAVEAVCFAVDRFQSDPLLRRIWVTTSFDANSIRRFTEPVALSFARQAGDPIVEAAGWDDAEAAEAIEVLVRFVLSLLTAPGPHQDPTTLRAFLRRRMVPALFAPRDLATE